MNGRPYSAAQCQGCTTLTDDIATGCSLQSKGRCICCKCVRQTALRALVAGSYGSTKRYKSVDRLVRINDRTVLGASGELSDLQYILK